MPILGVAGNVYERSKRPVRNEAMRNAIKLKKLNKRRLKGKVSKPDGGRVCQFQLYALELEDGAYYVGITAYRDVAKRFNMHVEGKGAKWTKLHKPIRIIETKQIGLICERDAVELETALTFKYMEKFGMYNVRGGSLCRVDSRSHAAQFNEITHVRTIQARS